MSTILQNLVSRLYPTTAPMPSVIILGLDNCGKTTFLYVLKLRQIVQTIPSFGINVEIVDVPTSSGGKSFQMTAWDIGMGCAGPRNFSLARMRLEFSEAIIWIVDASDRERLQESADLLRDILPFSKENAPILVLASKFDKPNPVSVDEIRIAFSKVTSGRLSSVFKTSFTEETCKNFRSSGLPEAFDWLNIALDISKSLNKGGPAVPLDPNLHARQRAPNVLGQKLESWLTRSESDMLADSEFLEKFRSYSLPDWDHYTHIRLAYLVLIQYGRQEGKNMIFKGLEDYIANSPQTKVRAFHVTMTYFWIQIVHLGIRNTPPSPVPPSDSTSGSKPTSLKEFTRFLLVNPHVVDSNLWSDFYSKEVLMSPEAKAAMVLSDKKPLPNLVTRDAITSFGA